MPPKPQHSKADIAEAAFAIAREQGLEHLTARALATRLGCSTSPIYSAFGTMKELEDLVCERSTRLMLEYQGVTRTGSPLVDLCLGYVVFAIEQKQLFRDMFLNKQELSEHSQEMKRLALEELTATVMAREPALAGMKKRARLEILEVLWTYAHGLAAQMNIGALDLPHEKAIVAKLRKVIDPLLK